VRALVGCLDLVLSIVASVSNVVLDNKRSRQECHDVKWLFVYVSLRIELSISFGILGLHVHIRFYTCVHVL